MVKVLREVHFGCCGEHQGCSRLFKQIFHLGYYWRTIEADAMSFPRKCQACHLHINRIHFLALNCITCQPLGHFMLGLSISLVRLIHLHEVITATKLYTKQNSRGHIWILTATECYTKLVKTIALKQAIELLQPTSFETMLFIDLIFLITFSQIMELPLLSPMCDNCPRNMELIISNPFLLSSREWPD